MGSTFNPQILKEKLSKLNSSQQSIETLSHWCIFHMHKAKFVVDTWSSQFHSSPREQKISLLYLANDILQNSRRKGIDFVNEFWRVLPDALRDVLLNGDAAGKKAARRLINIWDERKVFGARGHTLKEEFLIKQPENSNKSARQPTHKTQPTPKTGGELDEDSVLSRCTSSISTLENMVQDFSSEVKSGKVSRRGSSEELQEQHAILRQCIEQLRTLESSRSSLVLHVQDFLQKQESKLDRVQSQLKAAQKQSAQLTNVCGLLINSNNMDLDEQGSSLPPGLTPAPAVVYTRKVSPPQNKADDDPRRSAAADMATTSSAEMLNSDDTNSSRDNLQSPAEKRTKFENGWSFFSPPPPPPPPPLDQLPSPPPPPPPYFEQPPPPPSSPPPPPPLPPMMSPYPMPPSQFIQSPGPIPNMVYNYGPPPLPPPVGRPGFTPVRPPIMTGMSPHGHPYQNYQVPEGGYYNPSSVPMQHTQHQQRL